MKQTKKLVDGALSAAIFGVLLIITLFTPLLGSITGLFLSLPIIFYVTKHGPKPGSIGVLVFIAIAFILGGPMVAFGCLIFIIPGYIIGVFFNQKRSAFAAIVGGSLAYVAMVIVLYVGMILFLHVDFIQVIHQSFTDSLSMVKKLTASMDVKEGALNWDTLEKQLDLIKYFTPTLLVGSGVTLAFITILISYPILKRLGLDLPKWRPFREWSFPKSLLWYYLIAYVGILFFHLQEGSLLFSVFYNVFAMLELIMIIQGYIFVFYYAYVKKLNKSIPILVVVFSFLIPQLLMFLIRLLGIIDLGFNLRKRIK